MHQVVETERSSPHRKTGSYSALAADPYGEMLATIEDRPRVRQVPVPSVARQSSGWAHAADCPKRYESDTAPPQPRAGQARSGEIIETSEAARLDVGRRFTPGRARAAMRSDEVLTCGDPRTARGGSLQQTARVLRTRSGRARISDGSTRAHRTRRSTAHGDGTACGEGRTTVGIQTNDFTIDVAD